MRGRERDKEIMEIIEKVQGKKIRKMWSCVEAYMRQGFGGERTRTGASGSQKKGGII